MIVLHDVVRDILTPCEGVVIAIAVYAYGEEMAQIQPKGCTHDGAPVASVWIPSNRLQVIGHD